MPIKPTPKPKEPHLEHWENWRREPSPGNASTMLKALDPVIDSAISAHVQAGGPNLKSRAKLMALDAMERYDPKQSSIKTYLTAQLQGLIRTHRAQLSPVAVPERQILQYGHLTSAAQELEEELGREPTSHEIADRTGIPVERVNAVKRGQIPVAVSQFQTETGEVFQPATIQDRSAAWIDLVRDSLTKPDQFILDASLGHQGHPVLSNQDIARRLRLTPAAVSLRKARIQKTMDEMERRFEAGP